MCAWNWITTHSPEDFRFHLRTPDDPPLEASAEHRRALRLLKERVERLGDFDEKGLADELYRVAEEAGIEPKEFFRIAYQALIASDRGPRLASFIMTLGREQVLALLASY